MPGVTGVHIDRALTNFSIKYFNGDFVAGILAPKIPVVKESDAYFVYDKSNFRIPPTLRADKARTQEVTWTLSTDRYVCYAYGLHAKISDRERKNADQPLSIETDTVEYLNECLDLDHEYRVISKVLNSADPEWGATASTHFINLLAAWDDRTGADPRADWNFGKYLIWRDSRKKATDAFIPVEVSIKLSQMQMIDDLRRYTDPNLVTESGLPMKVWGLRVHESGSTINVAAADQGPASFSEVLGNNVILAHIEGGSRLKSANFVSTFENRAKQVRRWRDDEIESDVTELTELYAIKITAPVCGVVLANAITPTTGS